MLRSSPLTVVCVALLSAASAALSGCHHELPPATTLASAIPSAAANEASVIFLRPSSPCDESDYTIVVDEKGRFVANVAPGTLVQLSVEPGMHTFYAWSSIDLRVEKEPNFNPVSAEHVDAQLGKPNYVAMLGRKAHYDCAAGSTVDMVSVGPMSELSDEVPGWLAKVQPVTSDRERGQARLASHPALWRTYLEMGQARMARVDEMRAREARHNAVRAEAEAEVPAPPR